MRMRLVEAAILVFAEKGVDASVVDDVITTASVSRGTFYKYFLSNQELLIAASEALANELLSIVEEQVKSLPDPAERIAKGLLLFILTSQKYPLFARFACKVGLDAAGPTSLIYEYLPAHIEAGITAGLFVDMPRNALLDLISGTVLACVTRLALQPVSPKHPANVVSLILRGLGLSHESANRYVRTELSSISLSENSLLERTNKMFFERDPHQPK